MTSAEAELQRVRELLPFHALDALEGEDREFLHRWLAQHGDEHPELASELRWLQRSAEQARELAAAPAAQAGLVELMTRIAAEAPAPQPRPAAAAPPWWQRLFAAPRLAMAMAVLLVVQGAALVVLLQREPAEQEALSGAPAAAAAGRVLLSVAFKPDAREADLRALLASVNAEVAAGPSALGLWQLTVPAEAAEQALMQLRAASTLVESAQREAP